MKLPILGTLLSLALVAPTLAGDGVQARIKKEKTGNDIVDTAIKAGSFKTLVAAVQAAGLVETLEGDGPFTVFAPTDAAFAALPEGTVETLLKPENKSALTGVLTYHVVPGRMPASKVLASTGLVTVNGQRLDISISGDDVRIDGAGLVKTDILCSNGVIHVIDAVVLPADKNIVETAAAAGSFNTLLTAAKAAGLAPALTARGPLTVFAPTDEAFAALPEGTVASLLKPENKDQLVAILKMHVVSGRIYSDAAIGLGKAQALNGSTLKIRANAEGVRINQSSVVKADLDTSNGVIHVIDRVLLPE